MKRSEVGELLTAIASTDNRTIGMLDVDTWHAILPAGMPLREAMAAVVNHRRTSTEWLQPKHIIDAVADVRRDRLRRAGIPPIPSDLDQSTERLWSRTWCAAVKDGADDPQQIANEAVGIENRPLELVPMPDDVRLAIAGFVKTHAVPES
jgi:hypothetical protein